MSPAISSDELMPLRGIVLIWGERKLLEIVLDL